MGPESQGQMDTPYPTQDGLRSHSKLLSSRWWSLRVFSPLAKQPENHEGKHWR